ncbi:MAG: FHA domain-containing protein, partial [Gemmatimonadaceae bacterium]
MSYIQHGETQYPLQPGEIRIGSGPDAGIRIAGLGGPVGGLEGGDHLVLRVTAADEVVIRRSAAGPPVRVNGVELGSEPTPLIHGDKIEVAGHELLFGDERKSGGTQFLPGLRVPSGSAPGEPRAARTSGRASGTTGGRLVSLTDGREYAIAAGGLTLGRDAGNDVVIPSTEASRRHAVISLQGDGYVLGDRSTNGVFVNGDRVQSVRLLGRGDVIRIGNEEFRFYADAPAAPTAPAAPAAPATRATPATPA